MTAFALAVHARTHRKVVMVVSAQSGKTETIFDIIGERLDTAPVPTVYVGPSEKFLNEQFEPRLIDLMENTPLRNRIGTRQTKTRKVISGVPLRLAHAGSSTALKADPFGLGISDEVDDMLANVKGAGDPITLVDARGDSYADFVHAIVSTPGEGPVETVVDEASGLEFWADVDAEEVKSPVWRLWLSGSRYHWAWPCPHCEEFFIPRFSCLAWDKPKDGEGKELPSTPTMAARTAHLDCPHCGASIYEDEIREGTTFTNKEWMNGRATYVAPGQSIDSKGVVTGEEPDTLTISFWVSGLCSPFVSWGQRAARYVEAVRSGSPDNVRVVKNAGFGELYAPGVGEVPQWAEVKECALPDLEIGQVHEDVQVLTITVDVQKDRLIYVIRGWGHGGTSWLVDAGDLFGPTDEDKVWEDLSNLLSEPIDGMMIKFGLIDSGFRPGKKFVVPEHKVYEFVRRYPHLLRATKGSSSPMRKPITASKIDITIKGKEFTKGLELLRLDTDHFKSWVQQKVRWNADAPGAWFLPEDISEDYCRQIVSEARIRAAGGKVRWVQRSRQNHFLDCEAMQGAISMVLNLTTLRDGVVRRKVARQPALEMKPVPKPKKTSANRRPGWLGGTKSIW